MSGLHLWYWRQMAIWSQILKRPALASDYWQRIINARPNDAKSLVALALLKCAGADKTEAIALLSRALQADPNNAGFWFNQGFLQQEQGLHEPALHSFEQAITLDPKLDRAWYGKGLSLIKLQRLSEAEAALKRNTDLQPMSPYGWYQLAHLYHRQGLTERTAKMIRTVSGFEPKVAEQLRRETGVDVKN